MIICCYNCKLNSFILNILYTFSPLLHSGNSVDLDPAKILFLCASIACESQIKEIRCDNRRGLYFSKLTPDHTNIFMTKKLYAKS
jgi:hypothetical protein